MNKARLHAGFLHWRLGAGLLVSLRIIRAISETRRASLAPTSSGSLHLVLSAWTKRYLSSLCWPLRRHEILAPFICYDPLPPLYIKVPVIPPITAGTRHGFRRR